MTLRIVYVSWEFPPQLGGGIGTYVAAITRALAARGHDVTVLTVGQQPYPTRELLDGVQVVRLPLGGSAAGEGSVSTLRSWQSRADGVSEFLSRVIRQHELDLIEFPDYRGEGVSFLSGSAPAQRPTTIVRLHTPLSVLYRYNTGHTRYAVLEEYEHEALRVADRIVCPSRALADEMRGVLGDRAVDISAHPVDPLFLRPEFDASEQLDGCEVLYVGRFEQRKGVETLARAADAFLGACPDARLVMIGGDTEKSPQQRSMKECVRGLLPRRFAARVELVERLSREALLERYRAARLCVFPSHFENFPNTCLEAMALGKCVIGTDRSGMPEILADGVSGVIARSGDADDLARRLIELYNAPRAARGAMGRAARARIIERFAPDGIAAEMEALYAGFVRPRTRPAPSSDGAAHGAAGSRAGAPSVAVVIPCYNHGRFLPETLASVRALDFAEIECVVVDDGSTDPLTRTALERVESAGTRVIRQDNAGLASARNAGIRATSAPFFVALDADDKLDPRFIRRLLPPLLADPTLGYVYSHVRFFDASGGSWDCPAYDPRRLLVENLSVATALVRRRAYDEAGGYQPDMIYGFEDWDLWIALLAVGYHGLCVPEPLFFYRKHAGGSMLSETQKRRGDMVKRMIEHHRALFAQCLELSLASKDRMFFAAHMDAWRLREQLVATGATPAPPTTVDNELYQALLAKAELEYIENSKLWRAVQKLKRNPLYRAAARLRYGAKWEAPPDETDPRARLGRIKSSNAWRAIQLMKRTPMYRWYARRKYGPDHAAPSAN